MYYKICIRKSVLFTISASSKWEAIDKAITRLEEAGRTISRKILTAKAV